MKRRNSEDESQKERKMAQVQEAAPQVQEAEVEINNFLELLEMIEALSPALAVAVAAGNVDQVKAIIQHYDNYVNATYSEVEDYAFTPSVEVHLSDLGDVSHERGFHEICTIFEHEDCQLFGAELAVES